MDMSEIDRLLKADETNIRTMQRFFTDVSSDLPTLLNDAALLYETCSRAFGQGLSEETRAVIPDELTIKLFRSKIERGLLLARIGALYGMVVADFLRMRITAPLGNVRLQCESLALMKLFGQEPTSAEEWREILNDEEGIQFYRKYQRRLKAILKSYDLAQAYDRSSGASLHSRFIGLARGFRLLQRDEGLRRIQQYRINVQEFNPDHPDHFIAEVLFTLRVQARIFANLRDAAPEIVDPLLLETRIPRFLEGVTRLSEDLKRWVSRLYDQREQKEEQLDS